MSDPVFINTKEIPEKRKPGRPRKIKAIPNGTPSIEQQFRIFKNITEPYLLQKAEIPEKDFITKMKEMEYDAKTAEDKAKSSFKENKIDIRTDENVDEIALRNMRNDAVIKKNKAIQNLKETNIRISLEKKVRKPKQLNLNKGIRTYRVDNDDIPKNTIDGEPPRYEKKSIAKTKNEKIVDKTGAIIEKTSQGANRQFYTKKGQLSKRGVEKSQIRIPTADNFKQ